MHRTIEFWQPHYRQTLTPEDAREIVENVSGSFGILAEWEAKSQEADTTRGRRLERAAPESTPRAHAQQQMTQMHGPDSGISHIVVTSPDGAKVFRLKGTTGRR